MDAWLWRCAALSDSETTTLLGDRLLHEREHRDSSVMRRREVGTFTPYAVRKTVFLFVGNLVDGTDPTKVEGRGLARDVPDEGYLGR
ncbi:hypothetical protein VFPFJ_04405 [Purpureocillium lilacinum]|uniref:Uncharacterized protein n=1 Tax=Purpureocillium lilacinum TaxID=33203 RepID=A0A179HIH6_PURLI|nr:hypothetical protein VFPFJ_04405 [Purpureocillium lilacinum]OAQ90246.1 hypothetical protein VFPFJ_04405 [Purpureocillium lilacinum]